MAHFAKLDENNVVIGVHVVHNSEITMDGRESEDKGILFLKHLHGEGTRWVQTSYNGTIRKNFAGIGYKYDADIDAFVPPKPYASWLLDDFTCQWKAPTPMPTDGKKYSWDEATTSWVEIESEVA
jgi:hypothetical protein